MSYELHLGDCLDVLRTLPDASVDALVTDPPAGIGFMGKDWDKDKGGRDGWIEWLSLIMKECLRVLKPGGHALVWALPRTSHWTGMAIENAGFEIRDRVSHLFGTGFPKSLSVSKAIDDANGDERPVVGSKRAGIGRNSRAGAELVGAVHVEAEKQVEITSAASAASAAWEGWGTALKPACEDWWLARKPIDGTVAANVLEHGTGALNVDACRLGYRNDPDRDAATPQGECTSKQGSGDGGVGAGRHGKELPRGPFDRPDLNGRWPANVVFSHSPGCVRIGERQIDAPGGDVGTGSCKQSEIFGQATSMTTTRYCDENGKETVENWKCVPECAVAALDLQSGVTTSGVSTEQHEAYDGESTTGFLRGRSSVDNQHGGTGGASRFFYCAKPPTAERDFGLDHLKAKTGGEATDREDGSAGLNSPRAGAGRRGGRKNIHPTVKSIELMQYLCRLITPPGGTVLDCFLGSGTTGIAALAEGFNFIGIEREAEYLEIARARIEEDSPLFNRPRSK